VLAGATAGTAAAAAALWHAAPVLTTIPSIRRAWPTFTGLGRSGQIALTFDDGPDPVGTDQFLDLLAARGVRATFFVLGRMLIDIPSMASSITGAGHEIAVHGWDHRNLLLRTPASVREDLSRAHDLVGELTGSAPRWWRPPYGVLTGPALTAARDLSMQPVLWTAWGRDWEAGATPKSVFATAKKDLSDGGTLLLHDSDCTSSPGSWRNTLGSLPYLFDYCDEMRWRIAPLGEHLQR
jgi:peptidoglycan/xylan/chitin deacetylase (PgdA/CDA1 family)